MCGPIAFTQMRDFEAKPTIVPSRQLHLRKTCLQLSCQCYRSSLTASTLVYLAAWLSRLGCPSSCCQVFDMWPSDMISDSVNFFARAEKLEHIVHTRLAQARKPTWHFLTRYPVKDRLGTIYHILLSHFECHYGLRDSNPGRSDPQFQSRPIKSWPSPALIFSGS